MCSALIDQIVRLRLGAVDGGHFVPAALRRTGCVDLRKRIAAARQADQMAERGRIRTSDTVARIPHRSAVP
jgi:hypothetical protein